MRLLLVLLLLVMGCSKQPRPVASALIFQKESFVFFKKEIVTINVEMKAEEVWWTPDEAFVWFCYVYYTVPSGYSLQSKLRNFNYKNGIGNVRFACDKQLNQDYGKFVLINDETGETKEIVLPVWGEPKYGTN